MGGLFAPRGAVSYLRGGGVCMLHLGKRGEGSRCGAGEQPSGAIWEEDWRAAKKVIFRGIGVPRQPW